MKLGIHVPLRRPRSKEPYLSPHVELRVRLHQYFLHADHAATAPVVVRRPVNGLGTESRKSIRPVVHLPIVELLCKSCITKRRRMDIGLLPGIRLPLEAMLNTVPPESVLGKAVSYTLSEYQRLIRYLKYPYLTLDNNVAGKAAVEHEGNPTLQTFGARKVTPTLIQQVADAFDYCFTLRQM